jgi:thiol-disulfide isomerase/thioredoxin
MQRLWSGSILLMWAVLLIGGAFRPSPPGLDAIPRPEVGFPAPPITLMDRSGLPVELSDLRGRAVFINFWASWCGPCRMEMPEIQRLADDLGANNQVSILTVNMTSQESSAAAALNYLSQHGYNFPVLLDPTGQAGHDYRVLSLPTSLFVSPDGIVTARINGPLTRSAIADYLRTAGRQ